MNHAWSLNFIIIALSTFIWSIAVAALTNTNNANSVFVIGLNFECSELPKRGIYDKSYTFIVAHLCQWEKSKNQDEDDFKEIGRTETIT